MDLHGHHSMEFVRPNENIYISFCYAPVLVNLGVALSCWMGEQLQTPDELAYYNNDQL